MLYCAVWASDLVRSLLNNLLNNLLNHLALTSGFGRNRRNEVGPLEWVAMVASMWHTIKL